MAENAERYETRHATALALGTKDEYLLVKALYRKSAASLLTDETTIMLPVDLTLSAFDSAEAQALVTSTMPGYGLKAYLIDLARDGVAWVVLDCRPRD